MPHKTINTILTAVLTPASWGYQAATWLRNKLFDIGILKEKQFDIPVVSVGNITVGGTGKTPIVEFILRHLSSRYRIAVLSRGYKRKTSGYILANRYSTPADIGDEPLQIYRKFNGRVVVAVCEKRRDGISRLQSDFPDLDLIVLDDAFQHRYVKPKVSVLLTDYNRPFFSDKILPLGRLRESPLQAHRADMVVVTKCPADLSPLNKRLLRKNLELMKYQSLFFSTSVHTDILPVFAEEAKYQVSLDDLGQADSVLLLTGVANPRGFIRYFRRFPFRVKVDHYPDHHDFTRDDIAEIAARFKKLSGARKIIVTTEKDAMRLQHSPYVPYGLKSFIFYLPMEMKMLDSPDGDFIEALCDAIEGRSRISSFIDAEQAEASSAYEKISAEDGRDGYIASHADEEMSMRSEDVLPHETDALTDESDVAEISVGDKDGTDAEEQRLTEYNNNARGNVVFDADEDVDDRELI